MAAACVATPGLTVVVVPLLILKAHWISALQAFGLKVCEFHSRAEVDQAKARGQLLSRTIDPTCTVVVVSADVADYPPFQAALARRASQDDFVVRIVFDEVHNYVIECEFRPALINPFSLRRGIACQYVLLSGTINPTMIPILERQFQLQDPYVIRTSTARRNVRYQIFDEPAVRSDSDAVNWVKTLIASPLWDQFMAPKGSAYILFVPFIPLGLLLAQKLGLKFYRAGNEGTKANPTLNDEIRSQYLEEWQRDGGGIVATGSLGNGFDRANVRAVVFVRPPTTLTALGQGWDRAGRDDKPCLALMLGDHNPNARKARVAHIERLARNKEPDVAGFRVMVKMSSSKTAECVHGALSEHFEGTVRFVSRYSSAVALAYVLNPLTGCTLCGACW